MALIEVSSGKNVPNDVNVIIEIPAYSDPVKYEIDKETHTLFVDRFMGTAMQYPCNYGYIPRSLSEDGDPVDVLVITPARLVTRSVVRCRPIGLLRMTDESGSDAKVLAVPIDKLTPLYSKVVSFRDIDVLKIQQIEHFFAHYKDLEPGKWVKIEGWFDADEAKKEIMDGIERYHLTDE